VTDAASLAPTTHFDWASLQTTADVARLLNTHPRTLLYWLYTAPLESRYRSFEIPKRGGGMRTISAPCDEIRAWQDALLPLLMQTYQPHPSAHGFLMGRSVASNARDHVGVRHVLNVDLKDFFPSVHFGRVRGLFLNKPFGMGPKAAAVLAQLCTVRNGLPQGAPTSPILSNFAAAELDRRLTRLAKTHRLIYSRYADDLTFSCKLDAFPPAIAFHEIDASGKKTLLLGAALLREINASGFAANPSKQRLQSRGMRQSVTGLTVNARVNVQRKRVRKLRAMLHAWDKFGLEAAGVEHFNRYRGFAKSIQNPGPRFRHIVYGQLSYLKMVRGGDDPLFLKFCARVLDLDPNPSKFLKKMVFGDATYDVFISHASEDKDVIARPLYEALAKRGVKAFLDEAHIGWGENFTKKINTALGAARHVVAIVSSSSVAKDWPVLELNTALALETSGQKTVLPVIVGKPDLHKLPLIAGKDYFVWAGDAEALAERVKQIVRKDLMGAARRRAPANGLSVPAFDAQAATPAPVRKGFWQRLFGVRKPPP
jgi:RNA-directed DNA polymerase